MGGYIQIQVADRRPVEVPSDDLAVLTDDLETFGPDEDMPRSRKMASAFRQALAAVATGQQSTLLRLPSPDKKETNDVFLALERIRERIGLTQALEELRLGCSR